METDNKADKIYSFYIDNNAEVQKMMQKIHSSYAYDGPVGIDVLVALCFKTIEIAYNCGAPKAKLLGMISQWWEDLDRHAHECMEVKDKK